MIITLTIAPTLNKFAKTDKFIVGNINRITDIKQTIGGNGINASKMLSSLGCESLCMGIVGGKVGEQLKEFVDDIPLVKHNFVELGNTSSNVITAIKSIDDEATWINENTMVVMPPNVQQLFENLKRLSIFYRVN